MSARDAGAGELRGIYIESGISSRTLEPFCRVEVQYARGGRLRSAVGQLSPEEVRALALAWLEAAEGAIQDAAVYHLLVDKVGLPDAAARQFIGDLREQRADRHTMSDGPEADDGEPE